MSMRRYDQEMDLRYVDRTINRRLPSSCLYCAYSTRPGLAGSSCSGCKMLNRNNSNNK